MGKDSKKRKHESEDQDKHSRKATKKIEKVAKLLGYTNDTNPFGGKICFFFLSLSVL